MPKTSSTIFRTGYQLDALALMNFAQIVSAHTQWAVQVTNPQMPCFTVVSICRRGATPSILFRDLDGSEVRLKATTSAANTATKLLDRAFRKPFNAAQIAAQAASVAAQMAAHTIQPDEAPAPQPIKGHKITDADISITGLDALFLGSCGITPSLEVSNA